MGEAVIDTDVLGGVGADGGWKAARDEGAGGKEATAKEHTLKLEAKGAGEEGHGNARDTTEGAPDVNKYVGGEVVVATSLCRRFRSTGSSSSSRRQAAPWRRRSPKVSVDAQRRWSDVLQAFDAANVLVARDRACIAEPRQREAERTGALATAQRALFTVAADAVRSQRDTVRRLVDGIEEGRTRIISVIRRSFADGGMDVVREALNTANDMLLRCRRRRRRVRKLYKTKRDRYVKDSLYIQCSEIFTLRIEKLHTET